MKLFTIFRKNLKTVSRSWVYLLVLFVCPILLILISGAILNSNNFNNIQVGIIDKDPGYDFNLNGINNVKYFDSVQKCLIDLTDSKISTCLFVSVDNSTGIHDISIYLDNTEKRIEFYARQYILQNIVSEQASILEETADTIQSKITLYTTSISNSRKELVNVKSELEEQEKTLVDYKATLKELRTDFDDIYTPLKEAQPRIKEIKQDLETNQNDLENNITEFRNKKQQIQSPINSLDSFLSSKLLPDDYSYASSVLSSITANLDDMDNILTNLENAQNITELIYLVDEFDSSIEKLDEINATLNKIDSDLDSSIERTRNSEERVDNFITQLDAVNSEMNEFSKNMESNKVNISFRDAFTIPTDPIFIVFPLLIAIIITFTSLVLSNMFILKQVNSPSYLRDIITPTSSVNFILADYFVNLFFIAIQAIVLFTIGVYWFNIPIGNLGIFISAIFLTSSIFIFIGMGIAYMIKSQSLSMLLTIFFLMFLIIMSDLLAPYILAGPVTRFFISLNPFVILTRILKDTIILNKPINAIYPFLSRLGAILGIVIVINFLAKEVSKEEAMQ